MFSFKIKIRGFISPTFSLVESFLSCGDRLNMIIFIIGLSYDFQRKIMEKPYIQTLREKGAKK